MTGLLVPDEVSQRIERQHDKAHRARVAKDNQRFNFLRTQAAVAEDLIEVMDNPDERLMFGLVPLDQAMRGIGRKEACFITGRAHSGKTQLVLNLVVNNPGKHLLMFTPDEVDTLVLAKLVAMTQGMNLEEMEADVKAGSRKAKDLLRRTAEEVFPHLFVVDQTLTFSEMTDALTEARDYWGHEGDGMILDYLDLMPGEADYTSTKGKSTGIKRWIKRSDLPGVVIHQPKRGSNKRGQEIGMDDMAMAGETEATFVLGVFRKQDDEDLDDVERLNHAESVTVHVSKNKHPPCKRGTWDFWMDPRYGRIREMTRWDEIKPGRAYRHWSEAAEARAMQREMLDNDAMIPAEVGTPSHDPQERPDDPLQ